MVGEGVGEVAAAHVAGALSLDDAARVICARAQSEPLPELRRRLTTIRPRRGSVAFWSATAGQLLDGSSLGADHWIRNLDEPTLFASTIVQLARRADAHATVFVEVDPHPVLAARVEQSLADAGLHAPLVACATR